MRQRCSRVLPRACNTPCCSSACTGDAPHQLHSISSRTQLARAHLQVLDQCAPLGLQQVLARDGRCVQLGCHPPRLSGSEGRRLTDRWAEKTKLHLGGRPVRPLLSTGATGLTSTLMGGKRPLPSKKQPVGSASTGNGNAVSDGWDSSDEEMLSQKKKAAPVTLLQFFGAGSAPAAAPVTAPTARAGNAEPTSGSDEEESEADDFNFDVPDQKAKPAPPPSSGNRISAPGMPPGWVSRTEQPISASAPACPNNAFALSTVTTLALPCADGRSTGSPKWPQVQLVHWTKWRKGTIGPGHDEESGRKCCQLQCYRCRQQR